MYIDLNINRWIVLYLSDPSNEIRYLFFLYVLHNYLFNKLVQKVKIYNPIFIYV